MHWQLAVAYRASPPTVENVRNRYPQLEVYSLLDPEILIELGIIATPAAFVSAADGRLASAVWRGVDEIPRFFDTHRVQQAAPMVAVP